MTTVIEARGLIKRYGRFAAVDGIDLAVEKGEVFGLLGPNGSGKTTTILLLLGLTEPTAGSISVLGLDPLRQPLAVKTRVGYLPDQIGFYDHLTAWENLAYTARLAGVISKEADGRIAGALGRVRLEEVANRRVATFSRGMRQRLGLAEVLVKKAEIAILDEPTSGLDPQSTQELLDLIRELAGEGVTFVLSSHQLAMMQTICGRVALFRRGQVGLVGRVENLTANVLGGTFRIEVETENADLVKVLAGVRHVSGLTPLQDRRWRIDADADVRADVAHHIVGAGGVLHSISMRQATLDEVYVRFFEGENHDVAA
ncbi:ABC transporter ATP-binding protein [Mesorhizobium sp. B2-8-9]|uniref:ABC transporter ATP-binding protein n=1 Tax=Mesorhizobium sp. B2-8-9 TaxID=2589899 RepID=UPI00112D8D87|nr:ABC transporter ATP-binding protein [Mesorhizobium sp. B2-8-9]TPI77993.1 ABC transporter ATP-binding protein [Mesorhizobium sp. B2-8-9]